MPALASWSSLLRNLFRRSRVEQDLDDEIRSYLEALTAEKIAAGMTVEQARRAAAIELGGVEQVKERVREVRMGALLETVLQDLRYGLRTLAKNPGFTAVAVLTLALGIGATTAIFSLVNGILLRPLPYPHSDRLVWVRQSHPQRGMSSFALSPANLAAYRGRSRSFERFAGYSRAGYSLTGAGEPERLQGARVTADLFRVVGVEPFLGRGFLPEEDVRGRNPVCVLSHGLWRRRFGGDPRVVGRSLLLNEVPTQVVGIMPAGFQFPVPDVELWVLLGLDPNQRSPFFLNGVARLKAGVSIVQARAETTRILLAATRQDAQLVGSSGALPADTDLGTLVQPLKDALVGETRKPLLVLMGAVGLVLLIVCANVAGLLLSRATSRSREIALRLALGATPRRLVRQLLTESLLLASIGAAGGIVLAWWLVGSLGRLPALGIPRLEQVSVDGTVLALTALLAALTGPLFGLAPAQRACRVDLEAALRQGPRAGAAVSGRWINRALVAAQLAVSLVLLVGAGLLLRSFQRLVAVDPGFRPDHVLTARLALPEEKYADLERAAQLYDQLLERLRARPSVLSAAAVSALPLSGDALSDGYVVEGHEPSRSGVAPITEYRMVSPGYFRTMSIRLLRGRDFQATDRGGQPLVAIVDETLARRFWPDGNAVGQRLRFDWSQDWRTIVGVVAGVKGGDLAESMGTLLYLPQGQAYEMYLQTNLVVRTAGDPASAAPLVRAEVRAVDPSLPVFGLRTMDDVVGQTLGERRLTNLLMGAFALLAALLAAVGVYGLMSLHVGSRTAEFGIRLALGAQRGALLRGVVLQALLLAGAGVAAGAVGAFLLSRTLASLLFEVSATDPIVFGVVALLLLGLAVLASWFPARRAMRVDPLVALRAE